MRCFFHLANGHESIRDTEGAEVADLEDARTGAMLAIDELRREDCSGGLAWQGWRLDVTDGTGSVLLSISLDPIVH